MWSKMSEDVRGWVMAWVGLLCVSVMMIGAITVGTALGNGVPMARATTIAFREGLQAGLSNCPCAHKAKAEMLAQASSPTPIAEKKPCNSCAAKRAALAAQSAQSLIPVADSPAAAVPVPVSHSDSQVSEKPVFAIPELLVEGGDNNVR